ncbi:MAG: M48 family metallopeptidase [Bacteroidales bacterium]|jgi:predicted metal-dependent hydrolase|nr:M48 family metallopeptidase [Bacteroidales bacterium]
MKQLFYGALVIQYEDIRTKRKNLKLIVHPDGLVTVKAPNDISDELLEEKLRKRIAWILKQQNKLKELNEENHVSPYSNGKPQLYMGKEYVLHIKEGKRESINYTKHLFLIEILKSTPPEQKQQRVKHLLDKWYKNRAKIKFAEISEPIIQRFKKYNVEPSVIYIQKMTNRWSTCTLDGKIILNPELIKVPKKCIEYVITCELCHLLHRKSIAQFRRLLTAEMPDWKEHKEKLDQIMICEE